MFDYYDDIKPTSTDVLLADSVLEALDDEIAIYTPFVSILLDASTLSDDQLHILDFRSLL